MASVNDAEKRSKVVAINVERELFYDNEELRGEVVFTNTDRPKKYRSVMIILWARFVEYISGSTGEVLTLHMSKRPVAQEMELGPGEVKTVPFVFTIPANSPPSVMTKYGAVQWRVAVVHENPTGRGVSAAASKLFRKASLYHSLPAYVPTAQTEGKLFSSGNTLRAEATLSKDVFGPGEEISVNVTVHESNTRKTPAITGIKAKVMQHMWVRKSGRNMMKPLETRLAKVLDEKVSEWQVTHLADGLGSVVERTVCLTPELDSPTARPRCAYQIVQRPDHVRGIKQVNALPPSSKFVDDGKEVYITYEVVVEVRVPTGNDLVVTLPFTFQSGRDAEAMQTSDVDEEEFMLKVPMFATVDDELPAYDDLDSLSLPSYTSLRRNSADTVFAMAQTSLIQPPTLTTCPDDAEMGSETLQTPPVRTRQSRRHSLAVVSNNREGEQHLSPRSRRGSLTVFVSNLLGKESHVEPVLESAGEEQSNRSQHVEEKNNNTLSTDSSAPRTRRRSSAATILLENSISATANRTMRRLRANSSSTPVAPPSMAAAAAHHPYGRERRGSSRGQQHMEEDPSQNLASFKARYNANPVVVLETTDA